MPVSFRGRAQAKGADAWRIERMLGERSFDCRGWVFPFSVSVGPWEIESAVFRGATFSRFSAFESVIFAGEVDFSEACFKSGTSLFNSKFSRLAKFRAVQFEGSLPSSNMVSFNMTKFRMGADFSSARFDCTDRVKFWQAEFIGPAHFQGARFNTIALLRSVQFEQDGDFSGATFSAPVDFDSSIFGASAIFVGAQFLDQAEFLAVRFENVADFRRATFTGHTIFVAAKFCRPPDFDGALLPPDKRDRVWDNAPEPPLMNAEATPRKPRRRSHLFYYQTRDKVYVEWWEGEWYLVSRVFGGWLWGRWKCSSPPMFPREIPEEEARIIRREAGIPEDVEDLRTDLPH